jgi:hypothetical protein
MFLKNNSWPALELLKALAIAAMIINHSWAFVISRQDLLENRESFSLAWANIFHFFCFFNIWIPAIAGTTLRLQTHSSEKDANLGKRLSAVAFRWGIVLALGGYAFALWDSSADILRSFNPLHFMAVSFVLIALILKSLPLSVFPWITWFFIILAFSLDQVRSEFINQTGQSFLKEVIFGSGQVGWSLIPWLGLVLIGFTFSDLYLRSKSPKKLLILCALLGLVTSMSFLFVEESQEFIKRQTVLDQYSTLRMPRFLWLAVFSGYVAALSLATLAYQKKSTLLKELIEPLAIGSFWLFFLQFPIMIMSSLAFESYPFEVRAFCFPVFVLIWCLILGRLVMEIGRKKITLTLVKRRDSR